MARTALNANLTYPAVYTVPTAKYAIFNAFSVSSVAQPTAQISFTINGILLYTGGQGTSATGVTYDTAGPFAANAGDVIANATVVRSGITQGSGPLGINGFLYDTSLVKTPFLSLVVQNSTSYTVPAGKLAVFNAYTTNPAILLINGVPISGISFGILASTLPIQGPFIANAGDTIAAGAAPFATAPGQFTINGFLYPP